MATRKFLIDIDLDQNSIISAVIENRDSVIDGYPSTPVAGQIFYDENASNKKPFYYDGTTWVAMSSATASSVPFSGVTTGTNTTATMTVGTGASLTVSGSGTVNANRYNSNAIIALADGGTNANLTAVNGGILYSTATALAITSAGSSGNLLQSNGASAPTWITLGSIDHGSFGGLSDDDHAQYLVLSPLNDARNTIQASSASVTGLTIKEAGGSSDHPLYVIENSSGVHLFAFYRITSTDYRLYINSNAGTFNVSNTPYIKAESYTGVTGAFINISSSSSFSGGSINISGGVSGAGGSITTNNGGGSINTTDNGSIQFGVAANRITLQGTSGSSGKTQTLPNLTGTVTISSGTQVANNFAVANSSTLGDVVFRNILAGDIPSLTGTYLRVVPAVTSDNTVAPTASGVVGLVVKQTTTSPAKIFEVQTSGGSPIFTVGDSGGNTDVTVATNLTVTGNLTINGTTTTVNTSTLLVEDNFITVNSIAAVLDAGIEVERGTGGTGDNAFIRFKETVDQQWYIDNGTYEWIIARRYSGIITGDNSTTAFNITHNMNSKNVAVQVYNSSDILVYPEVSTPNVNYVTITFKPAPGIGVQYRVVVVG